MRIGILGAGVVGTSLAGGFARAGHEIMLSSREPHSERMAAALAQVGGGARAGSVSATLAFGEVVVVAIGWANLPQAIADAGNWAGKIVIDTTNRPGASASGRSAAQDLAAMIPGAHVVKAFNTIGAEHMAQGTLNGEQLSMFMAGDDAHAKAVVAQLVADVGFDPVDVGGLNAAHLLESLAQLWIALARGSYGRGVGFRLVRG